jgi:hypothetical protein
LLTLANASTQISHAWQALKLVDLIRSSLSVSSWLCSVGVDAECRKSQGFLRQSREFRPSHGIWLMTLASSCRHHCRGQTYVEQIQTRALVCLDLMMNDACWICMAKSVWLPEQYQTFLCSFTAQNSSWYDCWVFAQSREITLPMLDMLLPKLMSRPINPPEIILYIISYSWSVWTSKHKLDTRQQ